MNKNAVKPTSAFNWSSKINPNIWISGYLFQLIKLTDAICLYPWNK